MTGFFAIFTGLVLVNVVGPGETESAQAMRNALPDATGVMASVEGRSAADLIGVISRAVPSNILEAAVETQLLALIFVGVVFGSEDERSRTEEFLGALAPTL